MQPTVFKMQSIADLFTAGLSHVDDNKAGDGLVGSEHEVTLTAI